jgi:hypothetical protein
MKFGKRLFAPLLVIGLLAAMVPAAVAGGSIDGTARFPLRLARLTVLDHGPAVMTDGAAIPGVITVYGLTAGVTSKTNKITYPTFVAKKSQTGKVKFCLDFLTTATTTLYWTALGSGPMIVGLAGDKGIPVIKNKTYRAEFELSQAYVNAMAIGTYDIVVVIGPKPFENQLTGSGGMTLATIRIRFDK